jgi:hypothetical protein
MLELRDLALRGMIRLQGQEATLRSTGQLEDDPVVSPFVGHVRLAKPALDLRAMDPLLLEASDDRLRRDNRIMGLVREFRVPFHEADAAIFHLLPEESHFEEPQDRGADGQGDQAHRGRIEIGHGSAPILAQAIKWFPRPFLP